MIQGGGQVLLHMLPNVQQKTIKPIIDGCYGRFAAVYG
jgi:hypothetical protein